MTDNLPENALETSVLTGGETNYLGGNVLAVDLNLDGRDDYVTFMESGDEGRGALQINLTPPERTDPNVHVDFDFTATMPGGSAFKLVNTEASFRGFGSSMTKMDVDGDSHLDLVVGAPGDARNGIESGAVFVLFADADRYDDIDTYFGAPSGPGNILDVAMGDFTGDGWGYGIYGRTPQERFGEVVEDFGPDPEGNGDRLAVATGSTSGPNSVFVFAPSIHQMGGGPANLDLVDLPPIDIAVIENIAGVPTAMINTGVDVFDPAGTFPFLPDLSTETPDDYLVNTNFATDPFGSLAIFSRDSNIFGSNDPDQQGGGHIIHGALVDFGTSVDISGLVAGEVGIIDTTAFNVGRSVEGEGVNHGVTDAEMVALDGGTYGLAYTLGPNGFGENGHALIQDANTLIARDAFGNPLRTNVIDPDDAGLWNFLPTLAEGEEGGLGQSMVVGDFFGDAIFGPLLFWTAKAARIREGDFRAFDDLEVLSESGLNNVADAYLHSIAFASREDVRQDKGPTGSGWIDRPPPILDYSSPGDPPAQIAPELGRGSIELFRNFTTTSTPVTSLSEADFDTTNGYEIFGDQDRSGIGWGMGTGDVNGDGIDDMLITAPWANVSDVSGSGAVYTVMGGAKRLRAQDEADGEIDAIIRLTETNSMPALRAGLVIEGVSDGSGSLFGTDVTALGDINGDGLSDFGISQTVVSGAGGFNVGRLNIFTGTVNFGGPSIDMATFNSSHGFVVEGNFAQDGLGQQLAGGADINNDQINDILVSIPGYDPVGAQFSGRILGIYGRDSDFSFLNLASEFEGADGLTVDGVSADTGSSSLSAPAMIGDINNDMIGDFAFLERGQGKVHVIFGTDGDLPNGFAVDDLTGVNGFTLTYDALTSEWPQELQGGADLNGDGIDDFIVYWDGFGPEMRGAFDIVYGSEDPFPADLLHTVPSSAFQRVEPSNSPGWLDGFGRNISLGDFNADGVSDILFSAGTTDTGPGGSSVQNAGAGVILFGGAAGFPSEITPSTLDGDAGVFLTQPVPGAFMGADAAFAGDVDGDGVEDVLISGGDLNGATDKVYLVFGRSGEMPGEIDVSQLDGRDGFRIQSLEQDDDFGGGVSALGDVDGDGHADFAVQARFADTEAQQNAGKVFVVFGGHANLMALDHADGVQDGTIYVENLGIAYLETAMGLPGDGIFQGSFRAETVGAGSRDYDGDVIDAENNIIDLGGGDDFASGGHGDDTIDGGNGADILLGDAGNDLLRGGDGDDILHAGAGIDILNGGEGSDRFVIGSGSGTTTIEDYEIGTDTLDLTAFARSDVTEALINAQLGSAILTLADGTQITVEGNNVTPQSLQSSGSVLASGDNTAPDGTLEIVGLAEESQVLTADVSDISDADGLPAEGEYQWSRDGQDIAGATARDYTLVEADVGSTITVSYSYRDLLGSDEMVVSGATATVEDANQAPFVNGPSYNDSVQAGRFFAFGRGSDRFIDEDPEDTLTLSATLSNGSPLPDWMFFNPADGFFSGTPPVDLSETLEIRLRATDDDGAFADDVFLMEIRPANIPAEGQPVILGTAEEDQTLSLDLSNVTDADGYDPEDVTVEWFRDAETTAVGTGITYTLGQADVGAAMRAEVSFRDDNFNSELVTSEPTLAVINVNDPVLGVMQITGVPEVGEILTSDASNISDADGINWDATTYYWTRDGISISGATEQTYVITEEDLGKQIYAGIRVVDNFDNITLRSGANVFINTPPTGTITITGTAELGQTVTVDISGINEPDEIISDTISYQWRRDGADIPGPGDEGASYVLTQEDVGAQITVQVTYFDEGGTEEEFISDTVVPNIPGQVVTGTADPDDLLGGDGNDTILGLASDDMLKGGLGDDTLDGGTGIDTAVFDGPQSAFTLTLSPDRVTITDRQSVGQDTDTLISIEFLDFDQNIDLFGDNPMDLDIFSGPAGLSAAEFGAIIELY
ncbi:putative Ig domain-containing protein, partial [Sulfitobacter mediterraneus]|uniref:putative Ig domain-containing protein n=2 Tax=Sulfitobacter mediterraneus TaxID=83219 RepID=UPI00193A86D9